MSPDVLDPRPADQPFRRATDSLPRTAQARVTAVRVHVEAAVRDLLPAVSAGWNCSQRAPLTGRHWQRRRDDAGGVPVVQAAPGPTSRVVASAGGGLLRGYPRAGPGHLRAVGYVREPWDSLTGAAPRAPTTRCTAAGYHTTRSRTTCWRARPALRPCACTSITASGKASPSTTRSARNCWPALPRRRLTSTSTADASVTWTVIRPGSKPSSRQITSGSNSTAGTEPSPGQPRDAPAPRASWGPRPAARNPAASRPPPRCRPCGQARARSPPAGRTPPSRPHTEPSLPP